MKEESQARVARISGAGHLPGGEYESIHISGSAKIDGDAVCQEDVHVSGAATAKGDLAAKEIHVSGSLQVEGDVHAEAVRISGSAQFAGSMEVCGEMRVSGSAHICKAARIQQLRAAGSLRLDEGVECERFETHGGFAIQGLLNAEQVEIEVGGACQAGEIGGESVRIYRSATAANTFLSRLLNGARPRGPACPWKPSRPARSIWRPRGRKSCAGATCASARTAKSTAWNIPASAKSRMARSCAKAPR